MHGLSAIKASRMLPRLLTLSVVDSAGGNNGCVCSQSVRAAANGSILRLDPCLLGLRCRIYEIRRIHVVLASNAH